MPTADANAEAAATTALLPHCCHPVAANFHKSRCHCYCRPTAALMPHATVAATAAAVLLVPLQQMLLTSPNLPAPLHRPPAELWAFTCIRTHLPKDNINQLYCLSYLISSMTTYK